mmetsp:Transcript_7266/g.19441  ORF Transcript_7266/g.19441 Transcript_7266/m.19441 type:complete len:109 (+) Transcript_7266:209-535(+)
MLAFVGGGATTKLCGKCGATKWASGAAAVRMVATGTSQPASPSCKRSSRSAMATRTAARSPNRAQSVLEASLAEYREFMETQSPEELAKLTGDIYLPASGGLCCKFVA